MAAMFSGLRSSLNGIPLNPSERLAGVVGDFLVFLRGVELFRMRFKETHPFDWSLKEAEIAAGVRATPLEIRWHSDATIL